MKHGKVVAMALAAAVALALAGCGSSATGSGAGGITLKLVAADYGTGPQNSSQKYWQGIADAFHKQNPKITVTVQTINWNDFDSQVKTMVQNKQYPDVLEGDYFPDYAQAGLLYPAKDVTSPATFSNLLPVFAKLDTYNGTQYGMPFTTSARTLFYNKQLFSKAGITAPPQTWAAIQTDAAKIKQLGKIGFGLPLGPEEAQAQALLWFLGDGGGYQDASGKWVINSAPNVSALAVHGRHGEGRGHRAQPRHEEPDRPVEAVRSRPDRDDQRVACPDPDHRFRWGADLVRLGLGGDCGQDRATGKTLGVCDNVSVFKTDPSKKAAITKFLNFFYQDKYQIQFDKEYDLLPATNSAVQALSSSTTFGPFLKALPNSVQYSSDPVWTEVKTQIQQTIGTAMTQDPKEGS